MSINLDGFSSSLCGLHTYCRCSHVSATVQAGSLLFGVHTPADHQVLLGRRPHSLTTTIRSAVSAGKRATHALMRLACASRVRSTATPDQLLPLDLRHPRTPLEEGRRVLSAMSPTLFIISVPRQSLWSRQMRLVLTASGGSHTTPHTSMLAPVTR